MLNFSSVLVPLLPLWNSVKQTHAHAEILCVTVWDHKVLHLTYCNICSAARGNIILAESNIPGSISLLRLSFSFYCSPFCSSQILCILFILFLHLSLPFYLALIHSALSLSFSRFLSLSVSRSLSLSLCLCRCFSVTPVVCSRGVLSGLCDYCWGQEATEMGELLRICFFLPIQAYHTDVTGAAIHRPHLLLSLQCLYQILFLLSSTKYYKGQ
jgi:hypothetical protein